MIEQAVRFSDTCKECRGAREGWVVQLVKNGKLRWEVDGECVGCEASHQWVWGSAPDHVRDLLIERHGMECLKVAGEGQKKGVLLIVFREAFGASIEESKVFSRKVTGVGYEGTRVEVNFLQELLRERGVVSEVKPGSCA